MARCRVLLLLVAASTACASPAPIAAAPLTDSDPPPYTPGPDTDARTGRVTGIATTGGYDQAQAAAIRLVVAVRDGNEAALEQLLADPLGQVYPRLTAASRSRAETIEQIVRARQSTHVGADTPLDDLIDVTQLEVRPLSQRGEGAPTPAGLDDHDLLVTFPLTPTGRRLFRAPFGWPHRGGVVVRTTPITVIVAL